MNEPSQETPEKLLDRSATEAFQRLSEDLRETLLAEASRSAKAGPITGDDLYLAYQRLQYPNRDIARFADAQSVISQALQENRTFEWIAYAMAAILFAFELVLLGCGVSHDDIATRVASLVSGSLVELLILVPFRFAINCRRHNIALRMLGLIINRVDDPKKLLLC